MTSLQWYQRPTPQLLNRMLDEQLPALAPTAVRFPARALAAKRTYDVLLSATGLVLLSPVMAVVAATVWATLGRPVLFRSSRPGLRGEAFELYKFRTMRPQAAGRSGSDDDEARLTRVGRMLRSSSLDELPELWNVLRGDMSLVGPRPLLHEYLPLYSNEQARRHLMRPGLTGLAQVRGRNALAWDEKLAWDIVYVDQWRFALDLDILARTLPAVLSRRGISAPGHATAPAFTGSAPHGAAGGGST